MDIEPLDASFGAILRDIALADLNEDAFRTLYDIWLDYGLLVFPGQHLNNASQIDFTRRFGELEFEIFELSNVKDDGSIREDNEDDMVKILKGNMGWHHDSTYMPVQAKGAVFRADIVPSEGGETGWADMSAAYEALSDEMRALGTSFIDLQPAEGRGSPRRR